MNRLKVMSSIIETIVVKINVEKWVDKSNIWVVLLYCVEKRAMIC